MARKAPAVHPLRAHIEGAADAPFGRKHPEVQRLARASGLSAETIYRVARGDYGLRANNARLLSKATRGKVIIAELLSK